MKKKIYCKICDEDRECILKEEKITENIKDKLITYLRKSYICSVCNNEVYDKDVFDYKEIVNPGNLEKCKMVILIM